ncbi:MAG: hypothetical protein QOJ22_673 [Thermoleophilaceae bacterium]|jgi:Ca2+-binding RTX toxin-like protein|nr:hypothetical protein [Thermoleophilaceae bacterium]
MPSRRLPLVVLVIGALGALAVPAAAVLPGENGRIVFASGRDGTDATAQLFLLPVPSSTGGGTVSPAITSVAEQHRHPTWSPDRTKIAYARGIAGNFDIFIQDLTNPGSTPLNITNSSDVTDDRPAWSPDGARIAYESEVTNGSGQRDVLIKDAPFTGTPTNFTNTLTAGEFEGRPAWSPSSAVLYYEKNDPSSASPDADVVRKPVNSGTETLAVADSSLDEYQPSISPDGTQVCFTISNNTFNGTADIMVAPLTSPPSGGNPISFDLVNDDYNCTWSPDGQFIAYVSGTTGAGALVMVRSDDTSLSPITLTDSPTKFDGNPDWAPDGRPLCPDSTVSTPVGTPVTIPMDCVDTGPQYERTPVKENVANDGDPQHGTVGQVTLGDPSTVVYTPNQGFTGQDSLQFIGFDDLGFGSDRGTVTINVTARGKPAAALCGGGAATIVGTQGSDVLIGTNSVDVIAGLGGNDRIDGRRDNDVICGGSGRDRVVGGAGRDSVSGGSGNDRASGNGGNDRVAGGSGNDRVSGGSGNDRISGDSGRDVLLGGTGRDRLSGGSGRDRLDGGANKDVCKGGPSRDSGKRCERSFRVEL